MSRFIKTVDNFFTPEECTGFIDMAEKEGFKKHSLIWENTSMAKQLWELVKEHVPEDIDGFEPKDIHGVFHFYKFNGEDIGAGFDDPYNFDETEVGKIMLLVYLNDDFSGGDILLREDGEDLKPERGRLLLMDPKTEYVYFPVSNGDKYVLRADIMYKLKTTEK